jgi:PD-(D/E)XK nuclease superfamily
MNRFSPQQKGFSWSYTKLRDWRICPKKYYQTTILKKFEQPQSIELSDGNALHEAFKRRVEQGLPMPTAYVNFNDWGDEAASMKVPGQTNICEKEIALSRELRPVDYFNPKVWVRVKVDLIKLYPLTASTAAAQIVDYKTGKPKDEIIQLALYAQAIFSMFPQVIGVRAEYWWTIIKDKSHELFSRSDMAELWAELLPELTRMEEATAQVNFPAKKNGLCKAHCPVLECEHNGRT